MLRYFFDVTHNQKLASDPTGHDLPGPDDARLYAIGLLPDIARAELPDGDHHEIVAEVRCPPDRIVYRARLTLEAGAVDEPARTP
ncbi:DUF6894 family protein [Lichenibacterium dinghuense]|uniref:DUF6894 family protein n=1 Tax=Lichenibacterium dinghuense TaxID=2895977 RepID=UPI003D17DFF1